MRLNHEENLNPIQFLDSNVLPWKQSESLRFHHREIFGLPLVLLSSPFLELLTLDYSVAAGGSIAKHVFRRLGLALTTPADLANFLEMISQSDR